MQQFLAWVWFPVLLYVVALGQGLLAEAAILGRGRLPAALVAPVGLAPLTLITYATYRWGGTIDAALPIDLTLAAAGLALRRRDWRRWWPGWAAAAFVAAYALGMAPVALSGQLTWAGYNATNDPAVNFVAVDWILHHGFAPAPHAWNSYLIDAASQIRVHYPLGPHLVVGTLRPLTGSALVSIYQPAIAAGMGFAAMALSWLLSSAELRRPLAMGGAVVAVGANLFYDYAQLGGLKEVFTLALVATAGALALQALHQRLAPRAVVLGALPLAATLSCMSAVGYAYAGVLAAATVVIALVRRPRPGARAIAAAGAAALLAFGVFGSPALRDSAAFGQTAASFYSPGQAVANPHGSQVLGQLRHALPADEALGVWLSRDWRERSSSPARRGINDALAAIVGLLALVGLAAALWRRAWGPALLLATVGVTAAIVAPRTDPYGKFKLMIVLAPAVVLAALYGAWALGRFRRAAGWAAAAVVAGAVLVGDAIVYRQASLAPIGRLEALQQVGAHAAGHGLVDLNEWEEYGKYFLRAAGPNAGGETNYSSRPWELRRPGPLRGWFYDLDEQRLSYVESFGAIVTRRSPDASRPPANFAPAYANRWYELWVRRPGPRVLAHLPLQGRFSAQAVPSCPAVRALAAGAQPGDRLVAYQTPAPVVLDVTSATRSAAWRRYVNRYGISPLGPGFAEQRVDVPAGRYRVWIQGSSQRPLRALVDGREVGALSALDTPGQAVDAGTVTLRGGPHTLELVHAPRSLPSPGDGVLGTVGPLYLQSLAPGQMVSVPRRDATRLCGRSFDWIELVRRSGGGMAST